MKVLALTIAALACAALLSACGSQGIQLPKSSPYYRGAVVFRDHCAISNRVKTNGPNFNYRKENVEQVLYAIRNGGFSGEIMPENVVVGPNAKAVAAFLAKYSGLKAEKVPSTNIKLSTK
jgi:hypothetical protein